MRYSLTLLLIFLAGLAHAGVNVEFDKDRIEAGQSFTMSLVIPANEIPAERGVPHVADLQGFSQTGLDSTEDRVRDFFMGTYKVRKYNFHLKAPAQVGHYQLSLLWEMSGKERSLGKVGVDVQRSLDAAGMAVQLTPSRTSVYEGEQFSIDLDLLAYENFYGGVNLGGIDLGTDFFAHRIELGNKQFTRSSKAGVKGELSARVAYLSAIRAGNLSIPELKIEYMKVGAPKRVEKRTANSFFSTVTQEPEKAIARSGLVHIQVKALPAQNRPQDFSGLVGQYQFEASVDKNSLKVGEPLTLNIRIKGNGKPGSISDPKLPDFSDFRSIPPESQTTKSEAGGMLWTERTLKIYLYPKKKGQFSIAPIHYSWFDPAKGQYITQSSPEFLIQVEKGDANSNSSEMNFTPTNDQRSIEQLGQDIRHIHKPTQLDTQGGLYYHRFWYWIALLLPFGLAPYLLRKLQQRISLSKNVAYLRKQKSRQALQEQWNALSAQASVNPKSSLAQIENALLDYLGAQYNQEFKGLTRDALQDALLKIQIPASLVQDLLQLLQALDQARFSPMGEGDVHTLIQQARVLADRLQEATP